MEQNYIIRRDRAQAAMSITDPSRARWSMFHGSGPRSAREKAPWKERDRGNGKGSRQRAEKMNRKQNREEIDGDRWR